MLYIVMDSQSADNNPKTVVYRRHMLSVAVVLGLAVAFFSLTNPTKMPAALFIMAFVLLFVVIYGLVTVLVYVAGVVLGTLGQERLRPRVRIIKLTSAAIITVLLGLSSIGQLTVKDILTLGIFFGLLYFYVTRLARQ